MLIMVSHDAVWGVVYASFGRWALVVLIVVPFPLGWEDGGLFVIEFFFVQDKVCEVFDGILVDIFHEGFNARLWDLKFVELVNGVFMDGSSYSSGDCDEGVGFPSVILYIAD